MAAGIRSSNLPLGALVEVLGHADAGNGQRNLVRAPLDALVDAVRGIVISDPSGVANVRAALEALTNIVNGKATQADLSALQQSLGALQGQLGGKAAQSGLDAANQTIGNILQTVAGYAQLITDLQVHAGSSDLLIGALQSLTDAQGKAITAEQSRAATAEALARIIAAPKYSVPLDTITLPNGGAVYWNGSTSTGAGETSGGLRVPQGQTGIFSQHRTRFQPTAAQRTKLAGRPVQFMVAFRSTVGALTALRDSAGFSTLGGVIEGVPSIVGVKIYSIRPDLWLAVGDAVLSGNENVITIALQVGGNTLPVTADVSFVAIDALFMPVDATGATDVLADLMQPLAPRADNLIAAARVRYAPLLGAGPGVTDRALVIPVGQSGAGSLAIYGAPVAGLQAGTRVRCRFAIQVGGGAFVLNGVAQSDPPVTLIQLAGATVEMTDGSQVGAVADLKATSPTTYEASVTFTATGAERIAEFYLKVDENSAVRLTEGQIRLGLMFVEVLSTEPTTTIAAQTARLMESFRAFIAAAPDRFRDWCSASSLSDGDYGTIREAVAAMRTGGSQDQPNRVVVLPGTYTNECATDVSIKPAEHVEIVGKGARRDVEIIARLPDNQAAQDSQQPILLTRSGRLSGLTVRGRNVKYPGHLEAGNAPVAAIWDINDCEFVHEGATNWTETSALGVGQNDGSKLTATGSTFLSPTSGVGIHNNTAWARGALATFIGCSLIGTGDSATSLAVTSQGAGVMSTVNLRGCVLSGRIHHYVSFLPGAPLSAYRGAPWEHLIEITDSDPVDWLSPCPFDVLTLTSAPGINSAVAVGGAGAVRLLGRKPDIRPGAADYAARLHGSFILSVPEGQYDPGVAQGLRLGDMRGAAARPLDIFWDGNTTPVTIALDQNYSSMTNAQVLANLNGKLSAAMGGNTGGRAFSLSQPYHNRAPIRQPDREATAVNAGTATILKGHVLAKVGRRVRLMTSTDAASAFAGIALDDAVPGRSVRFLKTGLIGQAHLLFDGDQAFTAGARYQISATNPGRLVPGADLPVLSVRSVETYGAALEIIGTVAFTGSATEAVRDAFAAITYQDVPGLPAVIDTVVPKGGVGSEPVTVGGVTDTVANRLGALQAGQSAGSVAYDTLAQLNANLTPGNGSTAQVTADGANNGFYAKSGASGTGSWVRKSTATVPALDQRAASLEQKVQSRARRDGLAVTDERGNAILSSTRDAFKSAALRALRRKLASGLAITDEAGHALIHFTKTAIFHPVIKQLLADVATALARSTPIRPRLSGTGWAVADEAGNALLRVTKTDIAHPTIRTLKDGVRSNTAVITRLKSSVPMDWPAAVALAEMLHFVIYGQSLSVGALSLPVISTAPLPYADRFIGGVRALDGGTNPATIRASLTGLYEQPQPSGNWGETPCYGAMQMLFQLLRDEDGIDLTAVTQRFLASAPGEGGKSLAELTDIALLQRVYDDITYGKARAGEAGKSYEASALGWDQGEQDYNLNTPAENWKTGVRNLRTLIEANANATTGLSRTLPMLISQTATHLRAGRATPSIALAQLELCSEASFAFVTPKHFLPYATDNLHLTNVGSKWLGAYHGIALKRALFDGVKPKPLVADASERNGNTVLLRFSSAVGGLVLDTATCPNPGNYGFTLVDAGGADLPIASVALVGRDKVAIKTSGTVPAGAKVRNAWIGDGNRGLGNLRDRQGEQIVFDPSGINKPMHRWAPIFERTV